MMIVICNFLQALSAILSKIFVRYFLDFILTRSSESEMRMILDSNNKNASLDRGGQILNSYNNVIVAYQSS